MRRNGHHRDPLRLSRTTKWGVGLSILVVAVAGCGSEQPAASGDAVPGTAVAAAPAPVAPVETSEADWTPVAAALGREGKLADGVYRVSFPRTDLKVRSMGVRVAPGLALGSYAAFARYPGDVTMAMGDLVVTEAELQKVTDTLQAQGVAQTAVHKHLLAHSPQLWWTHFEIEGADAAALARAVRAALAETGTPPPEPASAANSVELDTASIDKAMDAQGRADGGIYKFSFAREKAPSMHGRLLPPPMGVTTAVNFQPTGNGKAAVNGDFVMVGEEVQAVIQALREGGVAIVELHHHTLEEQPRLTYLHFWGHADAVELATALGNAVAATKVAPAG